MSLKLNSCTSMLTDFLKSFLVFLSYLRYWMKPAFYKLFFFAPDAADSKKNSR